MPDHETLVIRFPARTGFLTISRLNATAFAALGGFDVDELDDLRLAVDEAVTWLLQDDDAGGSVELEFSDEAGVTLKGCRLGADDLPIREPGELAEAILGATVDHHDLWTQDGERRVQLSKMAADGPVV